MRGGGDSRCRRRGRRNRRPSGSRMVDLVRPGGTPRLGSEFALSACTIRTWMAHRPIERSARTDGRVAQRRAERSPFPSVAGPSGPVESRPELHTELVMASRTCSWNPLETRRFVRGRRIPHGSPHGLASHPAGCPLYLPSPCRRTGRPARGTSHGDRGGDRLRQLRRRGLDATLASSGQLGRAAHGLARPADRKRTERADASIRQDLSEAVTRRRSDLRSFVVSAAASCPRRSRR